MNAETIKKYPNLVGNFILIILIGIFYCFNKTFSEYLFIFLIISLFGSIGESIKIKNSKYFPSSIFSIRIIDIFFISNILILILIILAFFKNSNILSLVFDSFRNGQILFNFLDTTLKNKDPTGCSSIVFFLIAYFILIGYMKSKKIHAYSSNENNSRFSIFSFSLMLFSYFVLPFFTIYLIIEKKYFELSIILFFFIVTQKIFIDLIVSYRDIVHSYKFLENLNSKKVLIDIKKSLKSSNRINLLLKAIFLDFKMRFKISSDEEINKYNSFSSPILIREFLFPSIHIIEKTLISLSLLMPIYFSFLNLNLVTIVYSFTILTFWLSGIYVISSGIPNKMNIKLSSEKQPLENIYILTDNKEYFEILNKKNKVEKIYKNDILKIY